MTINILYFSHEFPPDIGGSGVVAYQNASALISLGCNVDLLTKNSSKLSCPDGVNLLPTKNYHIWFLNYIPYINKLDKYDYIFINDPHSIFFSGLFFSKKNLSKSICFLHGSEPELILNNQTWKKKIIWFKYFFLKAIVNSKVIVPVSFFMKKKFLNCLNEYQLKSIENKVKVLYAGMFKGGFKKDSYLNNNINIKGEVYFSCGRIIKEKGYDDIALTLSKLPKYFEYTWIIAGIGSYLDEFKKLCTELDIINNIIFLNNVPRQELKFWYEKSDCFILLSRLKESFSLVHLESQFFGIPAIGMNHSGMREAIKNNSTGFLLNDYSELYNILINKEYLKLDKNEIKEFSEKFDTCHQVNILLKYLIDK